MRVLADPNDCPFPLMAFFFQDRATELVTRKAGRIEDIAFRQVSTN